jgi:hypothetical protein
MLALTERLDKVADSLENQGFLKEAMEVDVIANTIEAFEKEAWEAKKSPQFNILGRVLMAIGKNALPAAQEFMRQGLMSVKHLVDSYGNIVGDDGKYPAKEFGNSYNAAREKLEQGDTQSAGHFVQQAMRFLEALTPIINQGYKTGMPGAAPRVTPKSGPLDMVFTNKPSAPMQKRAPLPHPARAMR